MPFDNGEWKANSITPFKGGSVMSGIRLGGAGSAKGRLEYAEGLCVRCNECGKTPTMSEKGKWVCERQLRQRATRRGETVGGVVGKER
jgi:hypothetical protein